MKIFRVLPLLAGAAVTAQVVPAATWLPSVRARFPQLSGLGDPGHVALTFDDGPDPQGTVAVLEKLAALGVKATFFVVGEHVERWPEISRRCVAEGHEVAVHGWQHRYGFTKLPAARVTASLVEQVTGEPPLWFRPPYGVLTTTSLVDAWRAGLQPVLWTAWAREWVAGTTSADVVQSLQREIIGGATVLLHDSDALAAPGTSRATAGALEGIVRFCRERGLQVGPLREHFRA